MDELIKLVKTYRFTAALDQRLRLAEEIFRQVEPKMRLFVFSSVNRNAAPDVLQEALKAIATSLRKFAGNSTGEFWAWSYRIARNKISDYCRRRAADRVQPTAEAELMHLIDESLSAPALKPGTLTDLDRAMMLLAAAKPECRTLLWAHYVQGFDYGEIAAESGITYDAARMKITRCLSEARSLVA